MNMNLKSLLVPAAVALAAIPVTPLRAQTVLFKSDTARHVIYRIPALVAYGNTLLYFGDDRSGVTDATAWGDVGSEGNISIVARRSDNCGDTWYPEVQTVVEVRAAVASTVRMAMPPWCATASRASCCSFVHREKSATDAQM